MAINPSLAAIASARPGDAIQLIRHGDRWWVDNARGQTRARLFRAFAQRDGTTSRVARSQSSCTGTVRTGTITTCFAAMHV